MAAAKTRLMPGFSPDQAAYVVGLHRDLVCRWAFGNPRGAAVLQEPPRGGDLRFVDVVELMTVREIRRGRDVPLQRIREAIINGRKLLGVEHPFARPHELFVYGGDIGIKTSKGDFLMLTGKSRAQHMMEPVIQGHLKWLKYDRRGDAERYIPMTRGGFRVELNRDIGLGHPMIMPTGISVAAAVYSVGTEGSVLGAARMLDVPRQAVELAVAYDRDRAAEQKAA